MSQVKTGLNCMTFMYDFHMRRLGGSLLRIVGVIAISCAWLNAEGGSCCLELSPAEIARRLADQLLSTSPEEYCPKGYRGYVYEPNGR